MFTFGCLFAVCSKCGAAYDPMAWANRMQKKDSKIKYYLECPRCGHQEILTVRKSEKEKAIGKAAKDF